jgi:hypothetical protein
MDENESRRAGFEVCGDPSQLQLPARQLMTLAEYSIVIGWQLDDRLQWHGPDGRWIDWLLHDAPTQGFPFTAFRCKPESSQPQVEV